MGKLSFIRFFPYDWMNDTRQLTCEAKGCWIDLLCLMWNAPDRGRWIGTYEEFSRVTGSPWERAVTLIGELHKVATVTLRDKEVTLENRRMIREDLIYKNHANRQKEYRKRLMSDAKVIPKKSDVRRQTLKETSTQCHPVDDLTPVLDGKPEWQEELPARAAGHILVKPPRKPPGQARVEIVGLQEVRFAESWKRYPNRHGRKAALKAFMESVKVDQDWDNFQKALDHYLESKEVAGGFVMNGSKWFGLWDEWLDVEENKKQEGTVW